jgi:hypothetical protein
VTPIDDTADTLDADATGPAPRLGRRQLLVTGGATLSLGALLAACGGESSAGEPGRVGYAPAATALPTETVDDAVLLRTAQSIELTIVDVYGTITDSGALTGASADLLARLIEDHTAAAGQAGDLVIQAGGEPYECTNSWYMERIVPQIFENIDGDPEQDIPPTDDPARDMLAVMDAMESMATSMYQGFVEMLTVPELRAESVALGAQAARHSAAVAIQSTGAPNAYVSPAVRGEEVEANESGLVPLHAIPSQFGTLSPYSLVIGAASSAGTRFTLPIETPADNSYIYNGLTCSA